MGTTKHPEMGVTFPALFSRFVPLFLFSSFSKFLSDGFITVYNFQICSSWILSRLKKKQFFSVCARLSIVSGPLAAAQLGLEMPLHGAIMSDKCKLNTN